MNGDDEGPLAEEAHKDTDQSRWDGPVGMDQIGSLFKQNIDCNEEPRKIIHNHSQIRNPFILNQEFISDKKWESIHLYPVFLFEIMTAIINLWGNDRDSISIALQSSRHIFYKMTSIGGIEIRIRIGKK